LVRGTIPVGSHHATVRPATGQIATLVNPVW
jgi:hypothetical protein